MVNLELSPELRRYERELREWSVEMVRPHARKADTDHEPPANWKEIIDSCPVPLSKNTAPAGAADHPEDLPTFPDGELMRGLVQYEMLNYGDIWAMHCMGGGIAHIVVRMLGTEEQSKRWYEPIISGGGTTGFALTEPQFGSDTSMIQTRAVRDGDTWVLKGQKIFCSHGASADFVVAFATTDPARGAAASEAFVVERGTPGFEIIRANEDKLGLRSWETSQLGFDDCRIPLENRLGYVPGADGTAGGGRLGALSVLNNNRPNVGSMAIGIAQAALDVTVEVLAEQRHGYRPHRWSAIQDDLDAMSAALERGRRMCRRAQWMRGQGLPNRLEASAAKAFSPGTAERVVRRCMQILGPDGASTDLLLEKWYRDLKILDIFEGTGQVQRMVVGKELAKQAG
ncbi:acyl-CoA dehydrogenase family protein [Streptosporangium sp. NPDC000563]|uniref:acyl-CoA dehydrogenase family protein n=1 Tax=Streptosporangium sp. NPDC000563 TaxID=3154366 RepID=UPI0033289FC1